MSAYQTSESYSHQLRPDIVIVKNGREKLVLDAKYKGEKGSGEFYGKETKGTIAQYKKEDLDKNWGHILIRVLSLSNSFLNLSSSLSLF